MENREKVLELVVSVVRELGDEMNAPELSQADEDTRLMGEKSALDSIALVSLIAEVEARVEETFGQEVVLADERAMSRLRSPFRRVGVLVDYVMEKINES